MRLGFIGGTAFVGRHMVSAALARGHDVTLFHRGRTGSDLFPDAEHVLGDRSRDLARLQDRRFDAVIDVCAYRPGEVHAVADAIGDRTDRYLYVSSVAAYRPQGTGPLDEESPIRGPEDLEDPTTEVIDAATYGPLEAMCEDAARDRFAERTIVLRPTYVIGPHDHTDRFTSWVRRISGGGQVLAAGPSDAPIQVIDARDLGAFAVSLAESGAAGSYHGVGPADPIDWADLLDACISTVGGPDTRIVWADPKWLASIGIDPTAFPLWGVPAEAVHKRCSPAKSLAAGLKLRPLAETISDIEAWDRDRGRRPLECGLDDETQDRALTALQRI
jgi:2'-hydroxyisoflavone reductase